MPSRKRATPREPEKKKKDPPRELKRVSDSNLDHLFGLAFKLGDWLHTLWNYYFVISTALVGWMLSSTPSWLPQRKLQFLAVYGLAWLVNFGLIIYNFRFLMVVLTAIEEEFREGDYFRSELMNRYLKEITKQVWWVWPLLFFHVAIAVFVGLCILSLTPGR